MGGAARHRWVGVAAGAALALWGTASAPGPAPGTALLLALLAAAAFVAALGYAGYAFRVLPQLAARGRLEVLAPNGQRLARLRIPRRRVVVYGAASAPADAERLPWIPGEDRIFLLRAEAVGLGGGTWRAGLQAWRRPPAAVVCAEAVWPYHLYPGPVPTQRVELYEETSFGAAGLTFVFRASRREPEEQVGRDVLAALPDERGVELPPLPPGGLPAAASPAQANGRAAAVPGPDGARAFADGG